MEKLIVGKIVKIHGIKGAVKVNPVIDEGVNFTDFGGVFVDFDGEFHKFEEVFAVSDMLGVKLEGIDTVEEAKAIVGKFVLVEKSVLEKLVESNSFFIEELKGSTVLLNDNTNLGILEEVDNFGSADIFYIRSDKYKNLTLPHIEGLVQNFDEKKKILTLNKNVFEEVAVYDDWYSFAFSWNVWAVEN